MKTIIQVHSKKNFLFTRFISLKTKDYLCVPWDSEKDVFVSLKNSVLVLSL